MAVRGDGALDQVRLLGGRRQPVDFLGVLDALGFLLVAQLVAGTAFLEASGPLSAVLASDPQRLVTGLAAAGAQGCLIGIEGAPQGPLKVIQVVDPVSPGPAVRTADA